VVCIWEPQGSWFFPIWYSFEKLSAGFNFCGLISCPGAYNYANTLQVAIVHRQHTHLAIE
jgi:hypothetical protein